MYNKSFLKKLIKEGKYIYTDGMPFIHTGSNEATSLELIEAQINFDPSDPNPQKVEFWTFSDGEYRKYGRF